MKRRNVWLSLALLAVIQGCSKSADEQKEEMVKCSGFSIALAMAGLGSPVLKAAETELAQAGITGQDTLPLGAAAQQYASAMDPAKATRLSSEGAALAKEYVEKGDSKSVVDFFKSCVATFKELGK